MADHDSIAAHPFFDHTSDLIRSEMRPQNTVTFLSEVDFSEVGRLRREAAAAGLPKPSYTAFVVKALALALAEFPYANRRLYRSWIPFAGSRLQRFHTCDVMVAVERDIPGVETAAFIDSIRAADTLTLAEITRRLHALATCDERSNTQWRQYRWIVERLPRWLGTLLISRLPLRFPGLWHRWRGGPALVSSPAKYGVDAVLGSWFAPLGVAFGLVRPRVLVKDGAMAICPSVVLTLNWDRRVMAGAQAARFFRRIVERLEQPALEPGRATAEPQPALELSSSVQR